MAHAGKIACHFPDAGNTNHDVYGIKFLPVGGNASNLLTIDKVYYLSASDVATMKAMSSDAERLAYLLSTNPTHRVWELLSYVPYDNTCTVTIVGNSSSEKFTVQVTKNGVDVTDSLDHFKGWAYIVNDVLPAYRLTVHNIPYSGLISSPSEIPVSQLIEAYKQENGVSDTRYDNTKGEYTLDCTEAWSKASGSCTNRTTSQPSVEIPYTLAEETTNDNVWLVVRPNVSDITITKIMAAYREVINHNIFKIFVYHESGVQIYFENTNTPETPSVTYKTIDGVTYNYITKEMNSSNGVFKLKRFNTYFIKFKFDTNNNHHYNYRNGGILGILGYTTDTINEQNEKFDISGLNWIGRTSSEDDMLNMNANDFGILTQSSTIFNATNRPYKCTSKLNYGGSTDTPSVIYGQGSAKIFKYTGPSCAETIKNGYFYSCSTAMNVTAEIISAPSYDDVNVGDLYFAKQGFSYNGAHYRDGFYTVTSKSDGVYSLQQETNPITEIQTYSIQSNYEIITYNNPDLTGMTIHTDKKYEILLKDT